MQADGENADEAVNGRRFAAVLCHGVLGYLEQPEPLVDQLCRCAAAGGVVSIMTGNAKAMAVRPALERRWDDALAAFDARAEIGVLGVPGRADTVEELSELMRSRGVEPLRWYGVWLFVDWLEFSGAELDPERCDAGGGDGRGRARSQPTRPLPPAQSRLPSRGTQEPDLTTGQPAAVGAPSAVGAAVALPACGPVVCRVASRHRAAATSAAATGRISVGCRART